MTEELARIETGTLARDTWDDERVSLIRRMYCKGASQEEFEVFIETCKRTGLSPLMKQIYCIMRKSGGQEQMTIQVGIDGFRLIADRTGRYVPGREASFTYDAKNKIATATAYVKKLVAGEWHEIAATVRWEEFAAGGNFWQNMPHHQLSKVAEAHALRRAFPADLSGLYIQEEMDQADREPRPRVEEAHPAALPARTHQTPSTAPQPKPAPSARVAEQKERGKRLKAEADALGVDVTPFRPDPDTATPDDVDAMLTALERLLAEVRAQQQATREQEEVAA
jgi:phage recombination protein Bet